MPVVVDTSEWIQFFRVRNSPEAVEVRKLLEAGEVVMVGVVFAELLRGARDDSQSHILAEYLSSLPYIETSVEAWKHAGEILSGLQRTGRRIPLPDAVIAALALENNLSVYSRDEHFRRVQGLEIHSS